MVVPIVYRKAPLFGFQVDYIDAVTGAGYKRFYGCAEIDSAAVGYFLTTQPINAKPTFSETTFGETGEVFTFDIAFGVAVTVANADCIINLTHLSEAPNPNINHAVRIYHYDGSTETALCATVTTPNRSAADAYRECLRVTLTEQKFSIGDILRVKVTGNVAGVGGTLLYHDPSSQQSLTEEDLDPVTCTTDLSFDIPFKIPL